jgi:hypothetical protein
LSLGLVRLFDDPNRATALGPTNKRGAPAVPTRPACVLLAPRASAKKTRS